MVFSRRLEAGGNKWLVVSWRARRSAVPRAARVDFKRMGASKPPDGKIMGRWGLAYGAKRNRKDSGTSSGDRLTDQKQFGGRRSSSPDPRDEEARGDRRRVGSQTPGSQPGMKKTRIEFDPGWRPVAMCPRTPGFELRT